MKIFASPFTTTVSLWRLIIGGFFVGLGATMARGCTSGHGICGIARGSKRSIVATLTFITAGVVTTTVVHLIMGNI